MFSSLCHHAVVVFASLLLLVSSHRVIGLRRGIAEKETRGSFLEPDPARCGEELRIFKKKIQDICEEDQQKGKTVSDGGCEAEAEALVSDGDYEVWSQSLVQCGPEKTNLLLWSGYQDAEREDVLRPLREQGGCVLHSQEDPDTRLGQLLNAPGVNTLKSCSFPKVKAFWVGASRQFASTWAARSQQVAVAIGYHIKQGRSYKTLFDTVFYRSELKAAVRALRGTLQVSITFTHPAMTAGDMHAATSVIYERARLLSPMSEKFQETTTWRWGACAKETLAVCHPRNRLDPNDARFFSNLGVMYTLGLGVARDFQKSRKLLDLSMKMGFARAPTLLGLLYQGGEGGARDIHKAKELYEVAIKRGDDLAFSKLGYLYETGQAVVQDFTRAKELYERGIEKGSIDARSCLGRLYQNGLGVARDFQKAHDLFEVGMADGDAEAFVGLGNMCEYGQGMATDFQRERGSAAAPTALGNLYSHGLGVALDFQKARDLFELSLERGWSGAPTSLGLLYQFGHGVAQDIRKAKELYELGIERGDNFALTRLGYLYETGQAGSTAACYDLGRLYYHGLGVAQDFQKARKLLELAMQKGDAEASTSLGTLYQFGQGVAQDFHRAKELYEIGIERGEAAAPAFLGNMYYRGLGVARDFQKARELFELSKQRGWHRASTSLGVLYEKGQGVAQDFQRAKELYEKSINSGDSLAPELLGHMYRDGVGVYENWDKAKELYEMGIERGSAEAATSLGYLYQQMAHANKTSTEYSPDMQEHYQGIALRKAKEMYELAIARGSTSALRYLALMYKTDLKSDKLACQWMAKAKTAGDGQAAGKLAEWHC
ncbi:esiB [Symbiodinium sp. CCMP2456]|nr:esiB [Symbiodinium sp. CCMP2456]